MFDSPGNINKVLSQDVLATHIDGGKKFLDHLAMNAPMPPKRFQLGRQAAKFHPKTLSLAKYLTSEGKRWAASLPEPAEKVFREYKTPPGSQLMLGNDQYGDCTCAGLLNKFISDTAHTTEALVPTTDEALALYSAVTGFDINAGPPGSNPTDNGAAMTDVLAYAQNTGVTIGGKVYKILAWAQVNINNLVERKIACDYFNGTYVGVNLPASAQNQFIEGAQSSWEVVPGDPIEGGHCIYRPGYGSMGDAYVTWANWQVKASAAWSAMYVEEEYSIITEQMFDSLSALSFTGLDLATLESDINLLNL